MVFISCLQTHYPLKKFAALTLKRAVMVSMKALSSNVFNIDQIK